MAGIKVVCSKKGNKTWCDTACEHRRKHKKWEGCDAGCCGRKVKCVEVVDG